MKPTVPETEELLRKLTQSASWWRRFVAATDDEEIGQLIAELSPVDLAMLAQRVREIHDSYRYLVNQQWRHLHVSDIGRLSKSQFAVSLVGLASFHHSGYVRQAAVETLALQQAGKELPFLLIRLNDWVPQVREIAVAAVKARLKPGYALHFLANMALLIRLKNCGRVDLNLLEEVRLLLKRPECKAVLESGTTSKEVTIRRISFQLTAEADPSTRTAIIRAVMTDPDAVTRYWAVRRFLSDVDREELPGIIEPMLNDRFVPIRRDALWEIATKRPDLAVASIRRGLLDNHVSLRETARHFLLVAGIADVRVFYIEALERGIDSQRFAAICGLGENGEASDSPLILAYLDSPLPKLRRAATYALGKLDPDGNLKAIFRMLSDVQGSVSKEAFKVLLLKVRQIPFDELEILISNDVRFHIRQNALKLVLYLDKWQKLPILLNICGDKDARISEFGITAVRGWFANYNRSFAEPTRADFEKIQAVLPKVETKLPHGWADELRACLKIYFK